MRKFFLLILSSFLISNSCLAQSGAVDDFVRGLVKGIKVKNLFTVRGLTQNLHITKLRPALELAATEGVFVFKATRTSAGVCERLFIPISEFRHSSGSGPTKLLSVIINKFDKYGKVSDRLGGATLEVSQSLRDEVLSQLATVANHGHGSPLVARPINRFGYNLMSLEIDIIAGQNSTTVGFVKKGVAFNKDTGEFIIINYSKMGTDCSLPTIQKYSLDEFYALARKYKALYGNDHPADVIRRIFSKGGFGVFVAAAAGMLTGESKGQAPRPGGSGFTLPPLPIPSVTPTLPAGVTGATRPPVNNNGSGGGNGKGGGGNGGGGPGGGGSGGPGRPNNNDEVKITIEIVDPFGEKGMGGSTAYALISKFNLDKGKLEISPDKLLASGEYVLLRLSTDKLEGPLTIVTIENLGSADVELENGVNRMVGNFKPAEEEVNTMINLFLSKDEKSPEQIRIQSGSGIEQFFAKLFEGSFNAPVISNSENVKKNENGELYIDYKAPKAEAGEYIATDLYSVFARILRTQTGEVSEPAPVDASQSGQAEDVVQVGGEQAAGNSASSASAHSMPGAGR